MTKLTNDLFDSKLFLPFVILFEKDLNSTWRKFTRKLYCLGCKFKIACYASKLNNQIMVVDCSLTQESGGDLGDITLIYDMNGEPQIVQAKDESKIIL